MAKTKYDDLGLLILTADKYATITIEEPLSDEEKTKWAAPPPPR